MIWPIRITTYRPTFSCLQITIRMHTSTINHTSKFLERVTLISLPKYTILLAMYSYKCTSVHIFMLTNQKSYIFLFYVRSVPNLQLRALIACDGYWWIQVKRIYFLIIFFLSINIDLRNKLHEKTYSDITYWFSDVLILNWIY